MVRQRWTSRDDASRNDVSRQGRDRSKRDIQNWYVKTRNTQQIEETLVKFLKGNFNSVLMERETCREIVQFFEEYIWPSCQETRNELEFIRKFKANAEQYSELDVFNRQLQGDYLGGFRYYEFRHVVNRITDLIRNEERLFPNASQFVKKPRGINRNWIYESELSEAYLKCKTRIDSELEKLITKYIVMEQKCGTILQVQVVRHGNKSGIKISMCKHCVS